MFQCEKIMKNIEKIIQLASWLKILFAVQVSSSDINIAAFTKSRTVYNSKGQSVQEIDAEGNSTVFSYDYLGNQSSKTESNGVIHNYYYSTNANSKNGNTITSDFNKLIKVTQLKLST